jgi:hypothetical protein
VLINEPAITPMLRCIVDRFLGDLPIFDQQRNAFDIVNLQLAVPTYRGFAELHLVERGMACGAAKHTI